MARVLILDGGGWLVFAGGAANTYSGGTLIRDGLLDLSKTSGVTAIPGNVVIGNGLAGTSPDLHIPTPPTRSPMVSTSPSPTACSI